MTSPIIWTIGHSTHPIEEFLEILANSNIQRLADVRLIPYSRRNPQYNTDALSASLQSAGIRYHVMPGLGGRRKSRPDSPNRGWRNASFRGYADYMQTNPFLRALEELMTHGQCERTVIMCAEALPWRCHRSLIADALTCRDWEVRHLMSHSQAKQHELTAFAAVEGHRILYPGKDLNAPPRLF
jgi:uncharacterized protein (DUF488 family)